MYHVLLIVIILSLLKMTGIATLLIQLLRSSSLSSPTPPYNRDHHRDHHHNHHYPLSTAVDMIKLSNLDELKLKF